MKLKFKKSKDGKAFFITLWRNGVHDYINPIRDWTVGLFIASFIFLAGVGYIAFDFYTQFGASENSIHVESESIRFRDVEVKRYAESYSEKERVFNALRNDRTYVIEVEIEESADVLEEEGALEESPELADIELAQ